MPRIAIILLLSLFILKSADAQKIKDASGTAFFRLEEDMSRDELKDKLRHQAIINAIEREFGTYITQESFVDIDDGNTEFRIFGKTFIRGEWLQTTSEEFSEEIREVKDGRKNKKELWLGLKTEGKVRQLTKPDIEFSYFTSNCPNKNCQTSIFEDGQPLYLFFHAPVDGYLSVFSLEKDESFRLLPYRNMPATYRQALPVMADKEYMFFSSDQKNNAFEDFSELLTDEMLMVAEEEKEYVELVLVFSTEEYIKPGLKQTLAEDNQSYEIPLSLPTATLKEWLEINRINSENFYYRQLNLKIVK
jgi:hypothetical protein